MAKFTDPIPFPPDWLRELDELEARWQGGDTVSQTEIDEALAVWRVRLERPKTVGEEQFDIVDSRGHPLGLTAPRWFAHLTGLRHRVVHVLLTTPQGLLAVQMRSHSRPEWPDRLDTTVAGHLKAGQDWWAGVASEVHEEIGLAPEDRQRWLAETMLTPVAEPFERYNRDDIMPPIRNRQVNRIFTGTLSAWGLAHITFSDGEVDGLYLTMPAELERLLRDEPDRIAPSLRGVFPICRDFWSETSK
jgi:isopentenyldiphosphate isomerase